MNIPDGYTYVDRCGMDCWVHNAGKVWITRYEAIPNFRNYDIFYAYRAVQKVAIGRQHWAVDNRSIGQKDEPFRTLEQAVTAANDVIEGIVEKAA